MPILIPWGFLCYKGRWSRPVGPRAEFVCVWGNTRLRQTGLYILSLSLSLWPMSSMWYQSPDYTLLLPPSSSLLYCPSNFPQLEQTECGAAASALPADHSGQWVVRRGGATLASGCGSCSDVVRGMRMMLMILTDSAVELTSLMCRTRFRIVASGSSTSWWAREARG